jgi:hypothetical protein
MNYWMYWGVNALPEIKYYFIHYEWSHPKNGDGKANAVLEMHPVLWLKSMIERNSGTRYRLTFYEELSRKE